MTASTSGATSVLKESKSINFLGSQYTLTMETENGQRFCLTEQQWQAVEANFKANFTHIETAKQQNPKLDVEELVLKFDTSAPSASGAPSELRGRSIVRFAHGAVPVETPLSGNVQQISALFRGIIGPVTVLSDLPIAKICPPAGRMPAQSPSPDLDDEGEVEDDDEIDETESEYGDDEIEESVEDPSQVKKARQKEKEKSPEPEERLSPEDVSILVETKRERGEVVEGTDSQFSPGKGYSETGCTAYAAVMLTKLLLPNHRLVPQDIQDCLGEGTRVYDDTLREITKDLSSEIALRKKIIENGKKVTRDHMTCADVERLRAAAISDSAEEEYWAWDSLVKHWEGNDDFIKLTTTELKDFQRRKNFYDKNPQLAWEEVIAKHPTLKNQLMPVRMTRDSHSIEDAPPSRINPSNTRLISAERSSTKALFTDLIMTQFIGKFATLLKPGEKIGALLTAHHSSYSFSVTKTGENEYTIQFFNSHGELQGFGESSNPYSPAYVATFNTPQELIEFLSTKYPRPNDDYILYPIKLSTTAQDSAGASSSHPAAAGSSKMEEVD